MTWTPLPTTCAKRVRRTARRCAPGSTSPASRSSAGNFEAAVEASERAQTIDPDNAVAVYQQARALHNGNRIDEAIAELERSLTLDSEYADAYNLLGLIHIEQGRFDEAVSPLQQAVVFDPQRVYAHNNLGVALERTGDLQGAWLAYNRVVTLRPEHGKAIASIARVEPLLPDGFDPMTAIADAGEAPTDQPAAVIATNEAKEGEESEVTTPIVAEVANTDATEADSTEDAGGDVTPEPATSAEVETEAGDADSEAETSSAS